MIMIKISNIVLENLFRQDKVTKFKTIKGIPKNYSLVDIEYDSHNKLAKMYFDDDEIKELMPEFERIK